MIEIKIDRKEVHLVILDYSSGTTHIIKMPEELLFRENNQESIENWILKNFTLSYSNLRWMVSESVIINT